MEWLIVVLIRLTVPLLILRWNLFGSILAIVADNLDAVILDILGVSDFSLYGRIDKFLDTYFYIIQGYTILFWSNKIAKKIGVFLLIYRIIGVVIFEITNLSILLFIFPNLFILFYMYYLIFKKIFKKEPFRSLSNALPVLIILLIFKLMQEYMLHIAKFPIYQWIKDNIFSIFIT